MAPTNRQSVAFRRLIAWEFKGGLSRDEVAHKYNISPESVDAAIRYFLNRSQKDTTPGAIVGIKAGKLLTAEGNAITIGPKE